MNANFKIGDSITWTLRSPMDTGLTFNDFTDFINNYTNIEVDNAFIKGNIIYYDELFSWEYEKHGTSDLLVLTLKDGSVETQEMYSRASILSPMNSYAPNKEIRHRKRKGASA